MDKADWLHLAPSFIASAVTLVVAFGIWKLTSNRENDSDRRSEERERVAKQLDAYSRLYGSLYVWPNAARRAFTDPSSRDAVVEYEAAMKDVALDYGLVLALGSWEMLDAIQERLNAAISEFDDLMAIRQVEGDPRFLADETHGPDFIQFSVKKQMIHDVRDLLLSQARSEGGQPSSFQR